MPPRYVWGDMWEALKSMEGKTIRSIMGSSMTNSIKSSTFLSYRTEARRLLKWHYALAEVSTDKENRLRIPTSMKEPSIEHLEHIEEEFLTLGEICTKETFFTFMMTHAVMKSISFAKVRAALRLAQVLACRDDIWAMGESAKAAEKSAYRTAQLRFSQNKRRGTLDKQMVSQLLNFASKRHPEVFDAMRVQITGGFRIGELVRIKNKHVTDEGVFILDQKRNRANQATSTRIPLAFKKLQGWPQGRIALNALIQIRDSNGTDKETLLFPRAKFTIRRYNSVIKEAAATLGWPSALNFDGSHVLRHAGVGIAVQEMIGEKRSMEDIGKTLIMSAGMITHYALSNSERLDKVHCPRFMLGVRGAKDATVQREDSEDEEESLDEELETEEIIEEIQMRAPSLPTKTQARNPRTQVAHKRLAETSPEVNTAELERQSFHKARRLQRYGGESLTL